MITNLQDYILNSKLFKTFQVEDLLFVEYTCLINEETSHIWAHHHYFAYVLGGQKKWKTTKGEYLVSSKEAIFVKKGANTVYQYFDQPFFVLFIFLTDPFIQKLWAKYPQLASSTPEITPPSDDVIPLDLNTSLSSFFQSMMAYFPHSKPPDPLLLKVKMEELLLNILTQPGNELLKKELQRLSHQSKVDLEAIMQNNYMRPLAISDYARLCARSLSSFRRDFKATFGMPPGKWLLLQRLGFSKFLLKTTNKTVDEILQESGFKNRSHFVKSFKEQEGVTPHQFRLNLEKTMVS